MNFQARTRVELEMFTTWCEDREAFPVSDPCLLFHAHRIKQELYVTKISRTVLGQRFFEWNNERQ